MANNYKGHHWQKLPVTSQVVIEAEYQSAAKIADSATYRAALENVEAKKNEMVTIISELINQMNSLKNHSETGSLVREFLNKSIKSLNNMVTQFNTIQKNLAAAEDANYEARIRQLEAQLAGLQASLAEDQAVDSSINGNSSTTASTQSYGSDSTSNSDSSSAGANTAS